MSTGSVALSILTPMTQLRPAPQPRLLWHHAHPRLVHRVWATPSPLPAASRTTCVTFEPTTVPLLRARSSGADPARTKSTSRLQGHCARRILEQPPRRPHEEAYTGGSATPPTSFVANREDETRCGQSTAPRRPPSRPWLLPVPCASVPVLSQTSTSTVYYCFLCTSVYANVS